MSSFEPLELVQRTGSQSTSSGWLQPKWPSQIFGLFDCQHLCGCLPNSALLQSGLLQILTSDCLAQTHVLSDELGPTEALLLYFLVEMPLHLQMAYYHFSSFKVQLTACQTKQRATWTRASIYFLIDSPWRQLRTFQQPKKIRLSSSFCCRRLGYPFSREPSCWLPRLSCLRHHSLICVEETLPLDSRFAHSWQESYHSSLVFEVCSFWLLCTSSQPVKVSTVNGQGIPSLKLAAFSVKKYFLTTSFTVLN